LGDVQPLALRYAFGDIEENDVAEILEADEMGERAADHAGPDEGNLVACHVRIFSLNLRPGREPGEALRPERKEAWCQNSRLAIAPRQIKFKRLFLGEYFQSVRLKYIYVNVK
jgi:hypothetical protein